MNTPGSDAAAHARAIVTPELVRAYAEDGVVCLRGILRPPEVAQLERGIAANLAAPSPRAKVASRPDDPGQFIEDFCNWQANADYAAVIGASALAHAAALLMQSASVRLYHDHMLTKSAGTQQTTPWHQDQPYYNVEGRQNASFWVPVDAVPREATLEFVAGSHRGPWLMPRSFMSNEAKWFPEGSLADLPDVEGQRAAFDIRGWAMEPGDAVCFHMLTLHASRGSATRRRVWSLRLLGDDMRHAPRHWVTSPAFPGLADELAAGAPLDHPLFPLLVTA
ncbi:MAG: phytanoyl-CoA dioxygenase family protein [Proteobacteria bacterium]|nr:phytanoyl-CoA dioxygenase family protein [Pseudomonadota bacterium]